MQERENNTRMLGVLALSILLHVAFFAALPWLSAYFERPLPAITQRGWAERDSGTAAHAMERERTLQLGRDEATAITTVAWIPHEDARELLARLDRTEQPAVQMQADPQPDAPPTIDATDAMEASSSQSPPPAQALAELPTPPTPPSLIVPSPSPIQLPESDDPQESVLVESSTPLAQEVAAILQETPPQPSASPRPAQVAAPIATTHPDPAPAAEDQAPPRPTSAARTEREAPPTAIEQRLHGSRSGRVQVMDGLEVLTVAPRVSVVSFLTSAPRDAVVEMTFDTEGRVTAARMVQSSRYADIDAAIEAAVFRWRAQGEKLNEAPHTIRVTFRM